MSMPREVTADVHSEVLSTVYYFQCVSVELVFCFSLEAFIVVDPDDLALLRVELHLPSPILLGFLDPLAVSWHLRGI